MKFSWNKRNDLAISMCQRFLIFYANLLFKLWNPYATTPPPTAVVSCKSPIAVKKTIGIIPSLNNVNAAKNKNADFANEPTVNVVK